MRILTFAFASGGFMYINREYIPLNTYVMFIFLLFGLITYNTKYYFFVFDLILVYGVFWFAYLPRGWIRGYNRIGDYSYGIYIYAFPIQQSIAYLIPGIGPYPMMAIAFPVTLFFAVLSWHLVEKPVLGYKGKLTLPIRRRFSA
jgi:peptidoglycan/LPS O-acetylase OafA/YrhL